MTMSNEPESAAEADSKEARAEGVHRMLSGEEAPKDTVQPSGVETGSGEPPPDGVGESITRRGEDVVEQDGKEAGRFDTGTDGTPGERPTGGSDARDATGVDPQEPITDSPPQGGQGGS
jgi:hypothetical protein